ncbi:MAG: hypothetical protein ACLPXB_17920 [Thiobacillaceae bacterium]
MNFSPVGQAAYALVLALAPVVANADTIFKCLGSDRKVFYQSTKCGMGLQGKELIIRQDTRAPMVIKQDTKFPTDDNFIPNPIKDDVHKMGFFTTGFIEGNSVTMMITAAMNKIEIPTAIARRIGIKCELSQAALDNQGGAGPCQSRVRSMRVGISTITNMEVTIMPVINTVIIGQSVLDHLKAGESARNRTASALPGNPSVQFSKAIQPQYSPYIKPHLMGGAMQGGELHLGNFVTTFAGVATVNGSRDGTGRAALFNWPFGIATDGTNLYVADFTNRCIRKIVIATGVVTTLAGRPRSIGSADGAGAVAKFNFIQGMTTDGTNLYVTDVGNHNIRKIAIATGVVSTLAGSAGNPGKADGTGTAATFNYPWGITTDGRNLYVTDDNNATIRKIIIASGAVTTLAGKAGSIGHADGTGTSATFYNPYGITTDGTNLYVTDSYNNTIRKIVIATGDVSTLAGAQERFGNTDGTGMEATFYRPSGITTDGTNLYVADNWNNSIRKIVIATGAVTTLAGVPLTKGDADGEGTAASFDAPFGITTDGRNLFVADTVNFTIRKIQ